MSTTHESCENSRELVLNYWELNCDWFADVTFRVERRDDCEYVCVQFYSLGHNFFPTLLFWSNLIHFFFSVNINIRLLAPWQSFFCLFVCLFCFVLFCFVFFILGLFAGYIFFFSRKSPNPALKRLMNFSIFRCMHFFAVPWNMLFYANHNYITGSLSFRFG